MCSSLLHDFFLARVYASYVSKSLPVSILNALPVPMPGLVGRGRAWIEWLMFGLVLAPPSVRCSQHVTVSLVIVAVRLKVDML